MLALLAGPALVPQPPLLASRPAVARTSSIVAGDKLEPFDVKPFVKFTGRAKNRAERKQLYNSAGSFPPRTSNLPGEGYFFFQNSSPKTGVQEDLPGFFTAETTEHWPAGRVIRNVSHPSLVPHLADPAHPQHDGTAVVVAPGGAYKWLTWDAEGADIAAWLNSIGVSAFLLKYRVPFRPWLCKPGYGCRSGEAPLMDAQRAMVAVTESCRLGCILLKMTAISLLTGAPALARRLARHQRLPHRLHGLQRRRPRHRARVHDLLRRPGAGVPSHRRRG